MKANWHLDVPVEDSDPFAAPAGDVRRGERLDLSDPVVLRARLVALVTREGQLNDRGVSCTIKDRGDSCCSACPLYGRASTRPLCKVGRDQEQTLMSMLAANA